ncbi:hypothetical protein niasHS_018068 [Heterodera schachtii]|uniref:Uncharacterized protein n=1 Tax=Heterodera schachtii TaxID=97005 RepID=A0ABD2HT23_HETSC
MLNKKFVALFLLLSVVLTISEANKSAHYTACESACGGIAQATCAKSAMSPRDNQKIRCSCKWSSSENKCIPDY